MGFFTSAKKAAAEDNKGDYSKLEFHNLSAKPAASAPPEPVSNPMTAPGQATTPRGSKGRSLFSAPDKPAGMPSADAHKSDAAAYAPRNFPKATDMTAMEQGQQMAAVGGVMAGGAMVPDAGGGGSTNNSAADAAIAKVGFIVKLMAIMQKPGKAFEIMKSKNFSPQNIKEHYGTDDPKKVFFFSHAACVLTVALWGGLKTLSFFFSTHLVPVWQISKMIFQDLQDSLKNGTYSIGRMAFFGGCYGTVIGILDLLPPSIIFKVASWVSRRGSVAATSPCCAAPGARVLRSFHRWPASTCCSCSSSLSSPWSSSPRATPSMAL